MAQALAMSGAEVALVDLNKDEGQRSADEMTATLRKEADYSSQWVSESEHRHAIPSYGVLMVTQYPQDLRTLLRRLIAHLSKRLPQIRPQNPWQNRRSRHLRRLH